LLLEAFALVEEEQALSMERAQEEQALPMEGEEEEPLVRRRREVRANDQRAGI
jgi:hypothetical protein